MTIRRASRGFFLGTCHQVSLRIRAFSSVPGTDGWLIRVYSVPFGPLGVSIPGEMKPMPPAPELIASRFRLSWIFS
jgi:hypothetical protein